MQAADSRDAVRPLVELVRAGKVPAEREEGVLTVIAGRGGPQELACPRRRPRRQDAGRAQESLLDVLEQATRQRNVRPAGDLARVGKLLDVGQTPACAPPPPAPPGTGAGRSGAAAAAGAGSRVEQDDDDLRQAAFDGLALLGGKESREAFDDADRDRVAAGRCAGRR